MIEEELIDMFVDWTGEILDQALSSKNKKDVEFFKGLYLQG